MKLSNIKPNPNNPRVIKDDKYKKLVKSLTDFPDMMAKRPMVCVTDKADGLIYPIGGNMRLRALKELKYKEIPDDWVLLADDWNEAQRAEFTIKDNVSFGAWDFDALANDWDSAELEDWGVDLPVEVDEKMPDDLSDFIETKFRIELILDDEKTQELLYNELISRGYECRILTL